MIDKTINLNTKRQKSAWLCQCSCGKEYITDTTSLLNGKATQCHDCAHAQIGIKRRKDLTGHKFGKLTVIDMIYDYNDNKSQTYCKCICECGNIIKRSANSLKRRSQSSLQSCGCAKNELANMKSKNVVGKKFGRLFVIEEYPNAGNRKLKCICDCGNEVIKTKRDVISGHTQSCGCLQVERASESNAKDWSGYISDYGVKVLNRSYQNKNGQWVWDCECFCGNHFDILPIKIANGHTTSCGCRNQSSRETLIEECLIKNRIDYIKQFSFPDCKNKYILKFDFAVLKDGEIFCLIEYDGMQHYRPIEYFGGDDGFAKTLQRDSIKNEYCQSKNIPLIRLKYSLSDNEIKEIVANILKP